MTEHALTFMRIFRNWPIMKWIIAAGNVANTTTLETIAALVAFADEQTEKK